MQSFISQCGIFHIAQNNVVFQIVFKLPFSGKMEISNDEKQCASYRNNLPVGESRRELHVISAYSSICAWRGYSLLQLHWNTETNYCNKLVNCKKFYFKYLSKFRFYSSTGWRIQKILNLPKSSLMLQLHGSLKVQSI